MPKTRPVVFDISPNPATGAIELRIDQSDSESREFRIFSLLGEEMLRGSFEPLQKSIWIDIRHLDPGLYLLTVDGQALRLTLF